MYKYSQTLKAFMKANETKMKQKFLNHKSSSIDILSHNRVTLRKYERCTQSLLHDGNKADIILQPNQAINHI